MADLGWFCCPACGLQFYGLGAHDAARCAWVLRELEKIDEERIPVVEKWAS